MEFYYCNYDFLKNLENEISQSIKEVEASFESEWEDDVHNSFYNYVEKFKNTSTSIAQSMSSLENVLKELVVVDGQSLVREADFLIAGINRV